MFFFIGSIFSQDKGQKLYNEGKFEEARTYYENILINREKDEAARFGVGASSYQQKDFETAIKVFNDVMKTDDSLLRSKALYNIGTLFNDQQKIQESLSYFKKAIESNPRNKDAKYNYEFLKRYLEKEQKDQQQDTDQKNDSKEQKNEDSISNQEDDDKKENLNGNQNRGDEQKGKLGQEEKENKQQQNNKKDSKDLDTKDKHQFKEDVEEQRTDKQLQADAILNALKDQEKINQKRQISKLKSRKLEKDW